MVYVQRDQNGKLLRVEQEPFAGMSETLAYESEELQRWLRVKLDVEAKLRELKSTDSDLARVLEDLINVMVEQGLIQYTDLPEAARHKLDERALIRADLEGIADHGEE